MIHKILAIKNVGLFSDGVPRATLVEFSNATLIYAENGRGKSTFASMLRACSLGDADRVNARKTADSSEKPEISLIVKRNSGTHSIKFENSSWSSAYSEIMVFDSEFVDQNVYSGFEVRPDQRESLLEFAIGDTAVAKKNDFERLTKQMEEQTRKRSDAEKSLDGYRRPYGLEEFLALVEDKDVEAKIRDKKQQIQSAERRENLAKRRVPEIVDCLDIDLQRAFDLLGRRLEDIADAAEATVSAHIQRQHADNFEDWLERGQSFFSGDQCPFCGQSISSIDLVRAYRAYFDETYNALKLEVADLGKIVRSALGDTWLSSLRSAVETNVSRIEAWQNELPQDVPPIDLKSVGDALRSLREDLAGLIAQKQDQPLECIGTDEQADDMIRRQADINAILAAYNSGICTVRKAIAGFMKELSTADISALNGELEQFEAQKIRFTPGVTALVTEYRNADTERNRLDLERKKLREDLDELMISTLEEYQERVNQLVSAFNAQFRIEKLKPTHKGRGNPRSEYALLVRNKSVTLGSRSDQAVAHSFGNTLSEADKRTLAFAFFIARLEKDSKLADRVVVFDDPVSSLDMNRRKASIRLICEIATKCSQVIVLSHDAYFVREFRDNLNGLRMRLLKPALHKIGRAANGYSAFGTCDIDGICESDYYRHYRLLSDYAQGISNVDSREVAKAIRPLLEGYLHRKYPNLINRSDTFGRVLRDVNTAPSGSPLTNLSPILSDLECLNNYASDFHHDTNPNADSIVLNETELESYVRKALDIVHRA